MATSFLELLPVITVLVFIIMLSVAGLVVSQKLQQCTEDAKKQLKGKNIDISNGGVRLGVRDVSGEEEIDRLQRALERTMSNSHANPGVNPKEHRHARRWRNHGGGGFEERVPVDLRGAHAQSRI